MKFLSKIGVSCILVGLFAAPAFANSWDLLANDQDDPAAMMHKLSLLITWGLIFMLIAFVMQRLEIGKAIDDYFRLKKWRKLKQQATEKRALAQSLAERLELDPILKQKLSELEQTASTPHQTKDK